MSMKKKLMYEGTHLSIRLYGMASSTTYSYLQVMGFFTTFDFGKSVHHHTIQIN